MANTHLTIRRRRNDAFDALAERLGVDVSTAVRAASNVLLHSPELLEQARAELAVADFIERLERELPRNAQLAFNVGVGDPNFKIFTPSTGRDAEPIDPSQLDPSVHVHSEGGWALDLADPRTGYALFNAWRYEGDEASCMVPIHALHVPRPLTGAATITEVTLPGDNRGIDVRDEDGLLRRYILDSDGTTRLMPINQRVGRAYEVAT